MIRASDGDKLTLVPPEPARLHVADVVDASSKAITGAYVKLQLLGTERFAHVDESLGRFHDRATAEARLLAIQQDLQARRSAVQDAIARGDAPAAGALDPFWEIGDRVDCAVQNVEERGSDPVPTDWRAKDADEPRHGTSLGEQTQTYSDQTFRCRGGQTDSGGQTLVTWVPFNDDGVVFPGKVMVARGGQAAIQRVEVLDPKN